MIAVHVMYERSIGYERMKASTTCLHSWEYLNGVPYRDIKRYLVSLHLSWGHSFIPWPGIYLTIVGREVVKMCHKLKPSSQTPLNPHSYPHQFVPRPWKDRLYRCNFLNSHDVAIFVLISLHSHGVVPSSLFFKFLYPLPLNLAAM